jgi:[phosphatase 2A protein]-leucine-carboxy methyltransferase
MLPPSHLGPGRDADTDDSIRQTDSDAAIARLSAVQRKYLHDPYIKHLVPRAHLQSPRPPLINIGTYIRSTAIDDLVHQWFLLSKPEGKPCQIVSLGAGSDTRFWRLAVRFVSLSFIITDTQKLSARRVRSKNGWRVMLNLIFRRLPVRKLWP